MGLSLDIGANTRAAVRNVGDVGEALSKVADSLDDLAREADRDAGRVETSLDGAGDSAADMGRDVERAGDRVERTFEDMVRDAKRADRAVADIGDNSGKSFGKIKDGAREVQNEFGQNLAESVSSVRGDISELGQVGQDTLGGLAGTVASMGPAGLVGAFALAAGAVGLGAVTAGIEEAEEKQQKLNETAAKFAEGYIAGINGAIDSAQVFAEINAIATDPERYKVASDNAKNWGVDVSTAMRAMAGDSTALGTVDAALQRQADALAANSQGADNYAQSIEQATTGQSTANNTYLAGRSALDALQEALALGATQAKNAQRALYDYAVQTGESTGKTDELGNAIVRLPGGKEVVINANTRTAYEEIDAFERRQVAPKIVAVRADLSQATQAIQGLNGQTVYVNVDTRGTAWGAVLLITITYDGGPVIRPALALRRTAAIKSTPRTVTHDILDGPPVYTLRPAGPLTGVLELGFTNELDALDCVQAHRVAAVFTVTTDDSALIGFRYVVAEGDIACAIDEDTAAGWVVSVPYQEVG